MRMYQMKAHFKGFRKLVTHHSCQFQRRRKMVSNVQSQYRKVTQGTLRNPLIFVKHISVFFEPVKAAVLLLEMVVIVQLWAIIQLEAFLTPSLATVLQLTEQCNQCLPKHHQDSSIKFCTLRTENCHG